MIVCVFYFYVIKYLEVIKMNDQTISNSHNDSKDFEEFLNRLEKLRVKLWTEDDSIRFKGPKGAVDQEILENLKKWKSDIIQRLKEKMYYIEPIERVHKKDYYPMSSVQKRMYILNQMDSDSLAYNISHSFKITGNIDKDKLESVVKKLIKRHEILRSAFEIIQGEPVQRVLDDCDF